jgi:hypothetical protein
VAQVAQSALREGQARLADLQPFAEARPTATSAPESLDLPPRSESVSRRAGCINRARPDLWGGAWGRKRPSLPDCPAPCQSHKSYTRAQLSKIAETERVVVSAFPHKTIPKFARKVLLVTLHFTPKIPTNIINYYFNPQPHREEEHDQR